jgi:hypothetical protein
MEDEGIHPDFKRPLTLLFQVPTAAVASASAPAHASATAAAEAGPAPLVFCVYNAAGGGGGGAGSPSHAHAQMAYDEADLVAFAPVDPHLVKSAPVVRHA